MIAYERTQSWSFSFCLFQFPHILHLSVQYMSPICIMLRMLYCYILYIYTFRCNVVDINREIIALKNDSYEKCPYAMLTYITQSSCSLEHKLVCIYKINVDILLLF